MNLLGIVAVPDIKPENREIKPVDTAIKSMECTVSGVDDPCHMSIDKLIFFWGGG